MSAYYNEIDPDAAQWLRNLIAAGEIAPGDVDERSIADVRSDDLRGYRQCHFFAGVGVWSEALHLAGWPDDEPVWTGSCPCQPFSAAGKKKGFGDSRHLWPTWARLIEECRPSVVFGEQVASKDGESWLDLVQADMEAMDYAFGPLVLPAAGFGAPHPRHRLWFVADTNGWNASPEGLQRGGQHGQFEEGGSTAGGLAEPRSERQQGVGLHVQPRQARQHHAEATGGSEAGLRVGDSDDEGSQGRCLGRIGSDQWAAWAPGVVSGFWNGADLIYCTDYKYRPVEPGTFPLAHGVKGRVGRLRAYGNAIVAPVAAEFIRAYMEASQ